jgi:hypothetical protein
MKRRLSWRLRGFRVKIQRVVRVSARRVARVSARLS